MYEKETWKPLETYSLADIYTLQTGCTQPIVVNPAYTPASVTIGTTQPAASSVSLAPNKALIPLSVAWTTVLNNDIKTRGRIKVIRTADSYLLFDGIGTEDAAVSSSYATTLPLNIVNADTNVKIILGVDAYDGANWYSNKIVEYTNITLVAYVPASISDMVPTIPSVIVTTCTPVSLSYTLVALNHDVSVLSYFNIIGSYSTPNKNAVIGANTPTWIIPASVVSGTSANFGIFKVAPDGLSYGLYVSPNTTISVVALILPVHASCGTMPSPITVGQDAVVPVVVTGGNCDRNVKFEVYKDTVLCATSNSVVVIGNSTNQTFDVTIPSAACLTPVGSYSIQIKMVLV